MTTKTALIVGATGLVGRELLIILLQRSEYKKVITLVRKPQGIYHEKLVEKVIDFDQLDENMIDYQIDDVFSCLGTTIKKAKSQEVMRKIDVMYPLMIAKLTQNIGAKQFLFVSAPTANSSSRIFYSRIKGELEDEVKKLDFHSVSIFRPSLLLGKREEFRLGEKTAELLYSAFSFLFIGPLKRAKAIQGHTVANAMFKSAQLAHNGVSIYESDQIEQLGTN
ncbi:oxidoreductase [Halalkalibacter wakoensis JCM 9140]|uniref:Oxidoreductase n=1 Tax=Halalkalibacter wakoensis JCM 9140 TaxID=1236970 RepID=W4Q483_9BACI|nr:NAD-dependent epimerase/dehydratase family protein [Halalkalibacter wakoensis]GAE26765.1 oxidoreductase [Halalkalibacter wakoensis JCM 9140]